MKKLILGSGSPRRKELLSGAGFEFDIRPPEIEETFNPSLSAGDMAVSLAELKSDYLMKTAGTDEWMLTADTVVVCAGEIMGKPAGKTEAREMLQKLSGIAHTVCSGVCIQHSGHRESFYDLTTVWFRDLKAEEIDYYINQYAPYDKAGAYGIQEWIGMIGITGIQGCYFNVMGLPVSRVYERLVYLTGKAFI